MKARASSVWSAPSGLPSDAQKDRPAEICLSVFVSPRQTQPGLSIWRPRVTENMAATCSRRAKRKLISAQRSKLIWRPKRPVLCPKIGCCDRLSCARRAKLRPGVIWLSHLRGASQEAPTRTPQTYRRDKRAKQQTGREAIRLN